MRKLLLATVGMTLAVCVRTHAQGTVTAPQPSEKFTFCAGVAGGNYEFTGIQLERQMPGQFLGRHTRGSMDNMDRVAKGECQGGIVQSDAYFVYMKMNSTAELHVERARDMYPEYAHLICNKMVNRLSDLSSKNVVLVGPPGSGSSVTWDAMSIADPKLKAVQTLPLGGTRALGKVSDGVEAQCMLFVAGLKTQVMMDANEMAAGAKGTMHLTPIDDDKLFDIKDVKGRPIYTAGQIPDGTYPNGLQVSGWFSSGKPIDTVRIESIFIDNVDYADSHIDDLEKVLLALTKAMPSINNRVLPPQ